MEEIVRDGGEKECRRRVVVVYKKMEIPLEESYGR